MASHSSTLAWKIPWTEPGRLQSMGSLRVGHDWATSLSLFTFHFHALEKEMATHSSVLAWRIPGTGKPGGLSFMGSHRVGQNWCDLTAAWVKIREIERLNQSKWLKPVRALGFRKKGIAFAKESSLTPKCDVNSGCSNKEELWLQGSEMEVVLWKRAGKWKRTSTREDWCRSFSLVPHQQRTGRMDVWQYFV